MIWVSISVGAAPGWLTRDLNQRKGNVRAQVDGQSYEGDYAQEEQHDEQHHRRHRVPDGPCGNVLDHLRACCAACGASSTALAFTQEPARHCDDLLVAAQTLADDDARPVSCRRPHRTTLDLLIAVHHIAHRCP